MFFLFDNDCYSKKRKKVTFNYEVYCILIPTRMELSFLKHDLCLLERIKRELRVQFSS
jgi:hypothetical protein